MKTSLAYRPVPRWPSIVFRQQQAAHSAYAMVSNAILVDHSSMRVVPPNPTCRFSAATIRLACGMWHAAGYGQVL